MKLARYACLIAFFASPALAKDMPRDIPDVQAALLQWVKAVEGDSLPDIMKLYDARAIVIGTFVQKPMTTPDAIEGYYRKVIANEGVKIVIDESHPRAYGNIAVNSGRYTLSFVQEGEEVTIPARFSFTYSLEGGRWLIVDQHSSKVPMSGEMK